jgi:antitoxin CptB
MAPQKAAGEDIAMRWRQLRYRASHRGTRELDLILGPYTAAAPPAELERLEELMGEEDTTLQKWLLGQEAPPPSADRDLITRIRTFKIASHGNR